LLCGRGLERTKATVVANAVDERRQPASTAAAPAVDRFVMMYHGTLTRIYGLDLAVEGFARAHVDMPGAELWILGSGTERDNLQALAERLGVGSSVKLVGQVPPADIPGWLAKCDVGVLPIRRDVFLDFAFPNKLPEFIVAGKPVLMARLKAITYYFSDQALAYFEPNDPPDMAPEMVALFRDRARLARLAIRAREEYAPIRWDVMKRRYTDVIGALAGARRPSIEGPRDAARTALAR